MIDEKKSYLMGGEKCLGIKPVRGGGGGTEFYGKAVSGTIRPASFPSHKKLYTRA